MEAVATPLEFSSVKTTRKGDAEEARVEDAEQRQEAYAIYAGKAGG